MICCGYSGWNTSGIDWFTGLDIQHIQHKQKLHWCCTKLTSITRPCNALRIPRYAMEIGIMNREHGTCLKFSSFLHIRGGGGGVLLLACFFSATKNPERETTEKALKQAEAMSRKRGSPWWHRPWRGWQPSLRRWSGCRPPGHYRHWRHRPGRSRWSGGCPSRTSTQRSPTASRASPPRGRGRSYPSRGYPQSSSTLGPSGSLGRSTA